MSGAFQPARLDVDPSILDNQLNIVGSNEEEDIFRLILLIFKIFVFEFVTQKDAFKGCFIQFIKISTFSLFYPYMFLLK